MSYKWPAKLCWSTYERLNLQSYVLIYRYVTYLQWQETHHHEAVQTTFIFCSLASDWPQLHPPESHRTYPAPMPLDSPHLFLFRQLPWRSYLLWHRPGWTSSVLSTSAPCSSQGLQDSAQPNVADPPRAKCSSQILILWTRLTAHHLRAVGSPKNSYNFFVFCFTVSPWPSNSVHAVCLRILLQLSLSNVHLVNVTVSFGCGFNGFLSSIIPSFSCHPSHSFSLSHFSSDRFSYRLLPYKYATLATQSFYVSLML